jgi:hypothetical protein
MEIVIRENILDNLSMCFIDINSDNGVIEFWVSGLYDFKMTIFFIV